MGFSTRIAKHIRSNVVGYVAVFLALTGTAAALPGTNSVDSGDIINGQVKAGDLGVEAVTRGRLAGDAVISPKIKDAAVKSADLSGSSVTGEKVADNSLTGVDVANGALTGGDIADSSIVDSNIAPETLTSREVLNDSLTGADIGDNSLTGADVSESTLGQVPASTLGGLGRSAAQNTNCDPESAAFATCVSVSLDLPAQTRVALFGRVTGQNENTADSGHGLCRLGNSTTGGIGASQVHVDAVNVTASGEQFPVGGATALTAITPPLGPGTVSFGIDCNQFPAGAVFYTEASIAAVAISPG
jgi:hypothetical protein